MAPSSPVRTSVSDLGAKTILVSLALVTRYCTGLSAIGKMKVLRLHFQPEDGRVTAVSVQGLVYLP